MTRPLRTAIAGAGQRGRHVYGAWAAANAGQMQVVSVVEPDDARLRLMLDEHPGAVAAESIDELADNCEALIIATPDRRHAQMAADAIAAGLHVLIEKPVAHSLEGVERIAQAADRSDRVVAVAHVLRYTPFFQTLNEVISSGRLGDLVSVVHQENVAAWHMAHSFVRGNWSRAGESAPMIVAKCCHDLDVLTWNLDSPVRSLSSIGSLFEFHPDRAPAGATARCTDPCPVADCPYDARRIYLDERVRGWPVHVITDDLSPAGRQHALETGPYGVCAYAAGSDVVDHQVVAMELESGASATLIMHGHSHQEQRTMRYDGTRATLRGVFGSRQSIEIIDHADGQVHDIPIPTFRGGHGGGDHGLLEAFVAACRGDGPVVGASELMDPYRLAFEAEASRLSGLRVSIRE